MVTKHGRRITTLIALPAVLAAAGLATGCTPDPAESLSPPVPAAPALDAEDVTGGASCGNEGQVLDYWPRTADGLRRAYDMCNDLNGLQEGIETELDQQG